MAEQLALEQLRRQRAHDPLAGRLPGARRDRRWISRATSSLPVPFSPRISTLASVGAVRRMAPNTRSMAGEVPIMPDSVCVAAASPLLRWRSSAASRRERRRFSAAIRVASRRSFSQGLVTKSAAPFFMASTASSTSLWAVTSTTTACGSIASTSASHARPSSPSSAPGGEVHVQQQHVEGAFAAGSGKERGSRRGLDGGEMTFQQQAGGLQDVFIVVDDQDAGGCETWCHGVRKRTGVRSLVRLRTVAMSHTCHRYTH